MSTNGTQPDEWETPVPYDEWLEYEDDSPVWLVPDLVRTKSRGMIHGKTQTHKSWLALQLCLDLASGQPIWDTAYAANHRRISTLLLQGEGDKRAWQDRIKLYSVHYPRGIPFHSIHTLRTKLDTPQGEEKLVRKLEEYRPELLVIDPLVKFFSGDDGVGKDVQRWTDRIDKWVGDYNLTCLLVHHDRGSLFLQVGKDSVERDMGIEEARGNKRFGAWADISIQTKLLAKGKVAATVNKLRDGLRPGTLKFEFQETHMVLTERADTTATAIVDYLKANGAQPQSSLATTQLLAQFKVGRTTLYKMLGELEEAGKIKRYTSGNAVMVVAR